MSLLVNVVLAFAVVVAYAIVLDQSRLARKDRDRADYWKAAALGWRKVADECRDQRARERRR